MTDDLITYKVEIFARQSQVHDELRLEIIGSQWGDPYADKLRAEGYRVLCTVTLDATDIGTAIAAAIQIVKDGPDNNQPFRQLSIVADPETQREFELFSDLATRGDVNAKNALRGLFSRGIWNPKRPGERKPHISRGGPVLPPKDDPDVVERLIMAGTPPPGYVGPGVTPAPIGGTRAPQPEPEFEVTLFGREINHLNHINDTIDEVVLLDLRGFAGAGIIHARQLPHGYRELCTITLNAHDDQVAVANAKKLYSKSFQCQGIPYKNVTYKTAEATTAEQELREAIVSTARNRCMPKFARPELFQGDPKIPPTPPATCSKCGTELAYEPIHCPVCDVLSPPDLSEICNRCGRNFVQDDPRHPPCQCDAKPVHWWHRISFHFLPGSCYFGVQYDCGRRVACLLPFPMLGVMIDLDPDFPRVERFEKIKKQKPAEPWVGPMDGSWG